MKKWLIGIVAAVVIISLGWLAFGYFEYYAKIAQCHDKTQSERSIKACSILDEALKHEGLKQLENRHPDRALESLNEAIEYNPEDYEAYAYRAFAYRMLKDYGKSAEDFKSALAYSNTITCKCAATALANYQSNIRENLQKVQAKLDHTGPQKSN